MTYLPMKARSELVVPVNGSGDLLLETNRRFHGTSAAGCTITRFAVSLDHGAMVPARSPTRGSGLGGDMDMFGAIIGPADELDDVELDDAHAALYNAPRTSAADR